MASFFKNLAKSAASTLHVDSSIPIHACKKIPFSEFKKHTEIDDLWLVIQGDVYDLSNFKHKGGKKVLLKYAGQDATKVLERVHIYKNNQFANLKYYDDIKPYKLGKLVLGPGETLEVADPPKKGKLNKNQKQI